MQIQLSSDNYDIVACGQAYLFGMDKNFRIDVKATDDFSFSIVLNFCEKQSGDQKIDQKIDGNELRLTCINFKNTGSGVKKPVKIATVDGKKLYFTFWSFVDGEESRSVRYTLFREK